MFLTIGILADHTNFYTFNLDAMTRFERGDWAMASVYIIVSVIRGLLAFLIGMILLRYSLEGTA